MPVTFNTAAFTQALQNKVAAKRHAVETAVYQTTQEGFDLIREGTPVRTGRARNSWYVHQLGPTTWAITSDSTSYILELEHGSSRQAPQGMARIAMMRLRQAHLKRLKAAMEA